MDGSDFGRNEYTGYEFSWRNSENYKTLCYLVFGSRYEPTIFIYEAEMPASEPRVVF